MQDPAQILRVLRVPGQLDEVVMHKRGKWRETDAFARVRESGRPDETLVPITPEQASVVLNRWRETRVIPLVEGVEFPSLPETSERAPRPGSGPVNAAAAQAIGDEWVNSSGFSAGRIRAGIWEFDRGYIVYPRLSPQDAQLNVGSARGVIDRATGRLSLWPSYPFPMVAQMYRESRDGDRRYEDGVDEFEEDED
ncbi:MAG TPA: hypothetical protein VGX23_02405 [Actinocrinis sp.]|nr:hypothetical protein [Actinocrinis sp.]